MISVRQTFRFSSGKWHDPDAHDRAECLKWKEWKSIFFRQKGDWDHNFKLSFIISPWCVDSIWQAFNRHSNSKLRYAWNSFRGICVKYSTFDFVDKYRTPQKKAATFSFKTVLKLLFLFPLFGLSFRLGIATAFSRFSMSPMGLYAACFFLQLFVNLFVCLRSITYLNLHRIFASAVFVFHRGGFFVCCQYIYKKKSTSNRNHIHKKAYPCL